MRRRDVLKLALAAGGAGALAARRAAAQDEDLLKYLCPPDGFPDLLSRSKPEGRGVRRRAIRAARQAPRRRARPAAQPARTPSRSRRPRNHTSTARASLRSRGVGGARE